MALGNRMKVTHLCLNVLFGLGQALNKYWKINRNIIWVLQ